MNLRISALVAATLLLASFSHAADVVVHDENARLQIIKNAKTWSQPNWISSDFTTSTLSPSDILSGPAVKDELLLLTKDVVNCLATQADQEGDFGGKTRKFYCQLMAPNASGVLEPIVKKSGKTVKIKVKYSLKSTAPEAKDNNEIYGEMIGTRLLWALGFTADRMFYVPETHCFGCSMDPYKDKQVDQASMKIPRVFKPTAIEKKASGSKVVLEKQNQQGQPAVVEGVTFKEMMTNLPDDATAKYYEYRDRDALRLLAVFMQHKDLKGPNQRLVCEDADANGNCVGKSTIMIQDIGASFGVGVSGFSLYKVKLDRFKSEGVWRDAAKCQASLSIPLIPDGSMTNPVISEIGRKHLANLLQGFISGPQGRDRVKALFQGAHIEERGLGETVDMWTDAFITRAEQVIYPMGKSQPNFKCPR